MDELEDASLAVEQRKRHADGLHRRALEGAEAGSLAQEAVEELYRALEELRVGQEELRVQNDELQRVGLQLERERLRYIRLFESGPDPYLVTDEGGVIAEANSAACRLLASKLPWLVGKPLAAFLPPRERREFRKELRRRVEETVDGEWELEIRPRQGPDVPVACTTVKVSDAILGASTLLWSVRDITERREAEARSAELKRELVRREAAEAARVQLDAIIRHLPVAVFVSEAPSGRVVTYSQAAERLVAYPIPLADGVEEYSELYRGYHADGRAYEPSEWPLARAIREGEVVVGEEIGVIGLDHARRVLRVSAAPVCDEEGRIVAGVSSVDDVTKEKRQAEEQRFLGKASDILSTSLDYQETVQRIAELCAQALADFCAVYVQEEDGKVRGLGFAVGDAGDEEGLRQLLRGVPEDAGPDHPILAVIRTGEAALIREVSDEMVEALAGDPGRAEFMRILEFRSILIVPLSAGGRTHGVISLARRGSSAPFTTDDQSLALELATRAAHAVDNARLYLDAQRTARVQEETINIVSHDLRNALNAALTNSDLLLDVTPAFESGSRAKRQMEAVRRSLDHMHRLVQDLLEVDRLDRGRLSMILEPLAPQTLVEELNGWLGPLAGGAGLSWDVDVPDFIEPIRADHARLVQVLSNLIGNAVKATPAGGRVAVRAENAGPEVHFHVTDTGRGIEPEHLPRIFDRFFQVPTGRDVGSGLGLTIARGIVEAHGGRIWAESTPGEGSTFSFALPVAARESRPHF